MADRPPLNSPLTTFFYVLMRDYLPTGTVKMLVERSKLAGDPDYSAPELEQLAERYAGELLMAPPREPVLDDEEPDHGSDSSTTIAEEKSEPARDSVPARILQFIVSVGRPVRPGEIDEAVGCNQKTRSASIAQLHEEGWIVVTGSTQSRRISLAEASKPDHDDSGEGDTPADPEDEIEEGEGTTPPLTTGGTEEPATSSMQQSPRDDDGGQSGAPVGAPPASPGEDVELMARVSDFFEQSDGWVWPREVETHFRIDAPTRRRIIDMLNDRFRIWIDGAGSPRVRYAYRGGAADKLRPATTQADPDEGLGESELHLRDPGPANKAEASKRRRAMFKISDEYIDRVKEWMGGMQRFTSRQIVESFDISAASAGRICSKLVGEGYLERHGEARSTSYSVKAQKTDGGPAGKRPLDGGSDRATLEGRTLGELGSNGGKTLGELAALLRVSEDAAKGVLVKLIKENEVHTVREGGVTRYVTI